jgi:hypothetical protein
VSLHCYSAIGLLAIDVFTYVGKTNQTFSAAATCLQGTSSRSGHLSCSFMGSNTFRFPHHIGQPTSDAESDLTISWNQKICGVEFSLSNPLQLLLQLL